jgi:NAD(P)-binding Rossmann-like domain
VTRRAGPLVCPPASRRPSPRAVVLGAGIAGLTAAHELAERGFQVTVYEARADERAEVGSSAPRDYPPVKLGGLAASQFSTVSGGGSRARLRPFPGRPGTPAIPKGAVPGEHGFRLFPAYYLHIWDLLQRIPLYEPAGTDGHGRMTWRPSSRTVMDNVRRVVVQATTLDGKPSLVFPREAPRTLGEVVSTVGQLAEFGFTPSDVQIFVGRLARYLVTSPLRRAGELANLSAYDFFAGRGTRDGQPHTYTPSTEALLLDMPKVLAGFDSRWGDARTNVTTYLQLLMHVDRGESKADGVLNGPTTEAWFDHWYRHLIALGVRFVRGEVVRLDPPPVDRRRPAHLRSRVTVVLADGTRLSPDYVIVAVDAPTAERITGSLRRAGTGGAVAGLDGFTTSLAPPKGPLQPSATRPADRRDPYSMDEMGRVPWDRFQTLAGIQFYFDTQFQPVRGHVYYSGTDWSLSSISQQAMWEDRPILSRDGFVSVLSVDIGAFSAPSRHLLDEQGRGKTARDCTADELAAEVWRQISAALTSAAGNVPESLLPTPAWYALDRNLVMAGPEGNGRPLRNEAPYLVPIVGDWPNRPDGEPWNPNGTSWIMVPTDEQWLDDLEWGQVWRAAHGGYPVHHNSLVFAGTWTRTFTRMTSMEAACESARHAVNAVLDHYVWVESEGTDRRETTTLDWRFPYDFLDQGYSGPVRQPTPAGDYCYVFDLENREPLDARGLRSLDAEYFVAGLPHPLDTLPQALPLPTGGPPVPSSNDYTGQLLAYLQAWRHYLEHAARSVGVQPPQPCPESSWPVPPVPPIPGLVSPWPASGVGSGVAAPSPPASPSTPPRPDLASVSSQPARPADRPDDPGVTPPWSSALGEGSLYAVDTISPRSAGYIQERAAGSAFTLADEQPAGHPAPPEAPGSLYSDPASDRGAAPSAGVQPAPDAAQGPTARPRRPPHEGPTLSPGTTPHRPPHDGGR